MRKMPFEILQQNFCLDTAATLDDIREAVNELEETERIARRVFGGTHPLAEATKTNLRNARGALGQRGG